MMTTEEREQFVRDIQAQAAAATQQLARHSDIGKYIDTSLPPPVPHLGRAEIRLIIVGQDPTIQNAAAKAKIKTVLNLDKSNSLRKFVEKLCSDVGLDLDQHVYATNAAKGFFTQPPTTIHKTDGVDVLAESRAVWIPLLTRELQRFPKAAVVSLGEPVLTMLSKTEGPRMRPFWGYHKDWRNGTFLPPMKLAIQQSTIDRDIFPFIHQPSMRKEFYQQRRAKYIQFIRQQAGL